MSISQTGFTSTAASKTQRNQDNDDNDVEVVGEMINPGLVATTQDLAKISPFSNIGTIGQYNQNNTFVSDLVKIVTDNNNLFDGIDIDYPNKFPCYPPPSPQGTPQDSKWNYGFDNKSQQPYLYQQQQPPRYYYVSYENLQSLKSKLDYVQQVNAGIAIFDINKDTDDGKLMKFIIGGAIVGGVIGSLVFVSVIVAAGFILYRRHGPGQGVATVVAMFDYVGKEENDLSFKAGDVIEVLERGDGPNDWWVGKLRGVVGEFPVNIVTTNSFDGVRLTDFIYVIYDYLGVANYQSLSAKLDYIKNNSLAGIAIADITKDSQLTNFILGNQPEKSGTPGSPPSSTPTSSISQSSPSNVGAIVGGVIASFIFVSVLVAAGFILYRRRHKNVITTVVAMFDFVGKEENDLSFKAGDIIEVLEKGNGPNDWWVGRLRGVVGEFPGKWVYLLDYSLHC
ncbi:3077_t:CDS:2 [Racocetra fulgida]|uniref:3077_t:CDS:1 n=1 Tax=Racocetra fulgida TaxID=60492 RepID=A0A9N9EWP6_9GLOM|nr:3077_t:CDS:2 [Racocetra fulgida]